MKESQNISHKRPFDNPALSSLKEKNVCNFRLAVQLITGKHDSQIPKEKDKTGYLLYRGEDKNLMSENIVLTEDGETFYDNFFIREAKSEDNIESE